MGEAIVASQASVYFTDGTALNLVLLVTLLSLLYTAVRRWAGPFRFGISTTNSVTPT